MAVAHREEVAVSEAEEVRTGDVCVLVLLVRILGLDASLGCERELGNHVRDLWFLLLQIVVLDLRVRVEGLNVHLRISGVGAQLNRSHEVLHVVLSLCLRLVALLALIGYVVLNHSFSHGVGDFIASLILLDLWHLLV